MLKKFSFLTPKSFSYPKKKSLLLKSLNLYSKDSEKNEDNILRNNNKKRKKNYFNLIKSISIKPFFSKSKIKQKYFKIFNQNLSPNNNFFKEKTKSDSPLSAFIKNTKSKGKIVSYRCCSKNKNAKKIKKSNSCFNFNCFSTINSTYNVNSNN